MKKGITLLLIALLCIGIAAAEELPYMEQIDQDRFYGATFLTYVSYPTVCLTPYGPYSLFGTNYSQRGLWFVSFKAPENASAFGFDYDSVSYVDNEINLQYAYQSLSSYAYETFLNKCDEDAYILMDGSDGAAAYISPERSRAYALIGTPQIEKGAKLLITLYYGNMNSKTALEKRVSVLTEGIQNEVARIRDHMQVLEADAYWSDGVYQGVKLISDAMDGLRAKFDLPTVTMVDKNGTACTALMFVTKLENARFNCCAAFGDGRMLELKAEMGTYSYVARKQQEQPESVYTMALDDGHSYDIYANLRDDGTFNLAYVQRKLAENIGRSGDDTCYWTMTLEATNLQWKNYDDLAAMLNVIMAGTTIEADAALID